MEHQLSGYGVAFLIGALLAFFLSTRQFDWRLRAALLVGGFGLLAGAAFVVWESESSAGYLRLLVDLAQHWMAPGESVIGQALMRNQGVPVGHIAPLLGFSIALAAVLGVLAVAALTPGERLERFLRPAFIGLLGMLAGSALAFTLVAIGFGGPVKARTYAGMVTEMSDVHDGDTFFLGEVSIRVWGLDAPELEQICRRGQAEVPCGKEAKAALFDTLKDQLVICEPRPGDDGPPQESFGRPLLQCRFEGNASEDRRDIVAREMIDSGYAIAFRGGGKAMAAFRDSAPDTLKNHLCMLDPRVWRRDPAMREAFKAKSWNLIEPKDLIGECSTIEQGPSTAP